MLELIGVRQSYPWGTKEAIPSLIGLGRAVVRRPSPG